MIPKICTIVQELNAGWNLFHSYLAKQKGSGLAVIYVGLTVTLLILLVFLSVADYALYSAKRNAICRGIDYAVCAAVQEIDMVESEDGLASGFDEMTGKALVNDIKINELKSDSAFFSTLKTNIGESWDMVRGQTLIITSSPNISGLDYFIRKGQQHFDGTVSSSEQLQTAINNAINQCWNNYEPLRDSQVIYVNGNPQTNPFKNVPYYMVFIKDFQINGLLKKRTATFVGFAGAKIDRRQ